MSYSDLESLKTEMQQDDHLRFENNRLYRKSSRPGVDSPSFYNRNHSKVRWFSRGRKAKFAAAKQTVQLTISEHLKNSGFKNYEAVAKKIMQPYVNKSEKSLMKSDLAQIVSEVEKRVGARRETSNVLSQQRVPLSSLDELVRQNPTQPNTWAAAFKQYIGGGDYNDVMNCFSLTMLATSIDKDDQNEVYRLATKWNNAPLRMPRSFKTELKKIVDSDRTETNFQNLHTEVLKYRTELTNSLRSEYDEFVQIMQEVRSDQRQEKLMNTSREIANLFAEDISDYELENSSRVDAGSASICTEQSP